MPTLGASLQVFADENNQVTLLRPCGELIGHTLEDVSLDDQDEGELVDDLTDPLLSAGTAVPPVSDAGAAVPPVSDAGAAVPSVGGAAAVPSVGDAIPPVRGASAAVSSVGDAGAAVPPVGVAGAAVPPVGGAGAAVPPVGGAGAAVPPAAPDISSSTSTPPPQDVEVPLPEEVWGPQRAYVQYREIEGTGCARRRIILVAPQKLSRESLRPTRGPWVWSAGHG